MATKERAVDRGRTAGIRAIRSIGAEIRQARRCRSLSLAAVGKEAGISAAELSRIERGEVPGVALVLLSKLCAIDGLDLAARVYPGGSPIRDARHNRLLTKFHGGLHSSLGWALEVPLPNPGDQRAWDGMVRGDGWRYGVEAELNPIDGQALLRRLNLKQTEGMVDGVVLLLPDTRQTRLFKREFADALKTQFPIQGSAALKNLAVGKDPGGSAMITL